MAIPNKVAFRVCVLACALALTGCVCSKPTSGTPEAVRSAACENRARTELYFGLAKPGGVKEVSADEWRSFLDGFVTPRFPEGLTVCDAYGQWRNDQGVVQKESTKLLILIHSGSAARDKAIEAVKHEAAEAEVVVV